MGLSRLTNYRWFRRIENAQAAPTGLQQVLATYSGVLIDMMITNDGFEIFSEFLRAFYSVAPVPSRLTYAGVPKSARRRDPVADVSR